MRIANIGIIGTGWIAEAHVVGYKKMADVEIVAAADLVPGKAEKFCKNNGLEGVRCYESGHAMLEAEELDGVSVCTFKCPHSGGGRKEWEVEAASIEAGIPALCKAGAGEELAQITAGGLMEVCSARFTRLAKTLEVPGGTVELALDRGVLIGKGRELPFAEVEVELKAGTDEAAIAFAKELAARFDLQPEAKSKFARAMALAME